MYFVPTANTACVVPHLLDPAATVGRMSPWHVDGVHPPAPDRVYVGTLSTLPAPDPVLHVSAPVRMCERRPRSDVAV